MTSIFIGIFWLLAAIPFAPLTFAWIVGEQYRGRCGDPFFEVVEYRRYSSTEPTMLGWIWLLSLIATSVGYPLLIARLLS